jgi:hypothetical protein
MRDEKWTQNLANALLNPVVCRYGARQENDETP